MQFFLNIKFFVLLFVFQVLHGVAGSDSVDTFLPGYQAPKIQGKLRHTTVDTLPQSTPIGYVSSKTLHLFKVSEFCQRAGCLIEVTLKSQKLAD